MPAVEPRVLRGFRDYLPSKMIPRLKMLAAVEKTFQAFGYVPLMTPALEYLDVLTGKYGDEGESLLFRFKDQGGRDVALRYDLTVPLARVVAQYPSEIHLPLRRYQVAPVWRAERPARGRFREFVQCDADIVGSPDMAADAEVVVLASELIGALGVGSFAVRINNRKVLTGLMERIGIAPGPAEAGILRTIDKLPKIGEEETRRLLRDENGLDGGRVDSIFQFLGIRGGADAILSELRRFFPEGSPGARGAEELAEVFSILRGAEVEGRAEIDLSIARGLNYYTGTIYEVFLGDLPGYGAVMGGGRYDGLIGIFKGEEIPAVGISLGVDRLLEGLLELGLAREGKSLASVLVTVFDAKLAPYSARIARLLRSAGVPCELFPLYQKIGKQFRHAERGGCRWVIVAGSEEASREEVSVKDLQTGRQDPVPLDGLVTYLSSKTGPSPGV